MKSVFIGHFRPCQEEFETLWKECIFTVDANVLLNLYRYSPATKNELEKALLAIESRVFIPHQAAKEFLKNRLVVTAGQANEYTKSIKSINELLSSISSKDRHPFLPEANLEEFVVYSKRIIELLENQQNSLLQKLTNDEILDLIEKLFNGKTGKPFEETELEEISKQGELRYQREIPPGYKDVKKDNMDDPYRKYGDLIVWKQIIEHAKSQGKPIVFITDDKKEDWWLEQSGRTIGPRPELIEEFYRDTNLPFWMYTVDKFVEESAKVAKTEVSQEVLDEIIKISEDAKQASIEIIASITISQAITTREHDIQEGYLTITLNKPMRYATGTGKFAPKFTEVPEIEVEIINSPYQDQNEIGLSFGCGTTGNFNVHLKGKGAVLLSGDYVAKYKAYLVEPTQGEAIISEG